MDALLAAAVACSASRAGGTGAGPARIVLLPVAAARERPELAGAHGRAAFEAAAARVAAAVQVDVALVTDRAAAHDPAIAELLAAADLVHLPGGDPDLPPALLRGTAAWATVRRAHDGGAIVAGASAGAMALGERLWTPGGPVDGLGLVPGVAVVPHHDPGRLSDWRAAVDPAGRLVWLGLDERTLVIGPVDGPWRVAGKGSARLVPPRGPDSPGRAADVLAVTDGGTLRLAVA